MQRQKMLSYYHDHVDNDSLGRGVCVRVRPHDNRVESALHHDKSQWR